MKQEHPSSDRGDKRFSKMAAEEAIVIRNARKCYKKDDPVLDNLNMLVSRGSIYGLLGSSGCGKTTLLSCVVGVRRLDSGDIWVLGGQPGSKGSGIPGPSVGYMPQEISLVNEFTTANALYYFGRISGIDDEIIEERITFLTELLQLPPRYRQVKHMSGGQQRRVSFAAAMVHKPELLILDEPTVGLDPVLRERIWTYLIKITREENTTVVITTHYIEEAKQANRIGMMRCGQLLIESEPNQILMDFQCQSLEQVFLTLSQEQADRQELGIDAVVNEMPPDVAEVTASSTSLNNGPYSSTDNIIGSEKQSMKANEPKIQKKTYRMKKFKALITKNVIQLIKHPGGIGFAVFFPLMQTFLFFMTIGEDLKDLHMAVVNEEAGNCNHSSIRGEVRFDNETLDCNFIDLSCRYLHEYDDSLFIKDYYPDQKSAYDAVTNGKAVGMMYFSSNFSLTLSARFNDGRDLSDDQIEEGQLQISLDMGDRQIGLWLKKKLYDQFFKIQEKIMIECQRNPRLTSLPMKFEDPIYGIDDEKFSMFMAPGFLLTVIFFLATSLTAAIIITDRLEGVWDRSLVTGVTALEILFAHVTMQFIITILQATVVLSVSFLGFDLICRGSLTSLIFLLVMTGFCGMCYGFVISVVVSSHAVANYVSTGSFYPLILLSGCMWPMEGMPTFLRYLSSILPTTLPAISMRAILEKGATIHQSEVYNGFLSISIWTICLITICILGLRRKTAV